MTTAPTYLTTLDHPSNRLQHDTSTLQPIPLIDDNNPYYPDPDCGLIPTWVPNPLINITFIFTTILTNQHTI